MMVSERRTLRCMFVIGADLVQVPISWTVTNLAGAVQWYCKQSTIDALVALGMITVTPGDPQTAQLTPAGTAQAAGDPIDWDGWC